MKLGCAERVLEVPLFVELCGYGHYADRRNRGIHDPIYCRAFVFDDGVNQAVIVYSDLIESPDEFSRRMRRELAEKLHLNPAGIAFVATHTHSAPSLGGGLASSFGYADSRFQQIWCDTVLETVTAAMADKETIASVEGGRAPQREPIGVNRIDPENGLTDPAIRWVRFRRVDGSVKCLLHNHGVHGIANNGPLGKYVSADWMGAANRLIKERKLGDYPLYLQGPAGNINTAKTCADTKCDGVAEELARRYVRSLEEDFVNAVPLVCGDVQFVFKTVEFPGIAQTAEELLRDAAAFRSVGVTDREKDYWEVNAHRLEEMALLVERGESLLRTHDLQIITLGDIGFYFVPGEMFVETGLELLEGASARFPLVATVSNGSAGYLFTAECSRNTPNPAVKGKKLFGYYEVTGYMHSLQFRFPEDIATWTVKQILSLEAK